MQIAQREKKLTKKAKFDAKKEQKKLKLIVSQLPEELEKITEGLVEDAAFMAEQLEKLRAEIKETGWTSEYRNSETQYGTKPSAAGEQYIKLQKLYAANIKQLTDLIPKNAETSDAAKDIKEFLGVAR